MSNQAFLSYSHQDLEFAAGLQRSIESFDASLLGQRSIRVFRDDSNLDANPDLWGKIASAIDDSSYFILLASPASAASKWVQAEANHFLKKQGAARFCVVVIGGRHRWLDEHVEAGQTDSAVSAEICERLSREFGDPHVLDMRRYRTTAGRFDRQATDCLNLVASLAAGIVGRDKDQLYGAHLARQRRVKQIVGAVACLLLLLVSCIVYQERRNTVLETRLVEIIDARDRLQEQLEIDRRRHPEQLAGAQSDTTSYVSQTSAPNADVVAFANMLKTLLVRFEGDFGQGRLSPAESLDFRLGKATVANAEKRFHDALAMINQEDENSSLATTDTENQINRAIRVLQVRGDSFYGLRDWPAALKRYQRILVLRPRRSYTEHGIANCYSCLGRLEEAIAIYDKQVDDFTQLVEHQGKSEWADHLAWRLSNRGLVLVKQGKLDEAVKDFGKAIEIRRQLARPEGQADLAYGLASSLNNRGLILRRQGKLAAAIADYDEATELYTRLVNLESRTEFENDLVSILTNRGQALDQVGKLDAAISDYDRAISIRLPLVNHEAGSELSDDLAFCFYCRGLALTQQGKPGRAAQDYEQAAQVARKAIKRYTRLVDQQGRSELSNDLAWSHTIRGNALHRDEKPDEALNELDKAVEIRTRLVDRKRRSELANHLAYSLTDRGIARAALGKLHEALRDHEQAIGIRRRLVEEGQSGVSVSIAWNLSHCGRALRQQGKSAEAIDAYGKAIEIYTRSVEREGRKDLASYLASSFNDRGRVFREQEELDRLVHSLVAGLLAAQGQSAESKDPAKKLNDGDRSPVDQGNFQLAIQDHDRAIEIYGQLVSKEGRNDLASSLAWSHHQRGLAFGECAKLDEAIQDFEKAIEIYTPLVEEQERSDLAGSLAGSLNAAAEFYATGFDDAVHDANKALVYATQACALTNWKELNQLETLAAAYAAVGDFESAVKWQTMVINMAPEDSKKHLEARLDLYKSNMPYRGPPPS